jgi:AmiR/NasT family two-component response regulator
MAKVTLSIDDQVLQKYLERAVRKSGRMRSLSQEVEEILRGRLANEQVLEGLKALCCGRDAHFATFDEIEAIEFRGTPPAEEVLRSMRRHRA